MSSRNSKRNSGMDDMGQDHQLDECVGVVKENANLMKKAISSNILRDALKHASKMAFQLAESRLTAAGYFELYKLVAQELQHLHGYFEDSTRHGRQMEDLYEQVQQAGSIVPRLYLLATTGSAYIKSKEVPAAEILHDCSELCKGIQQPLRGLFLRYYLGKIMEDKLPDVGSEYAGEEGGNLDTALDFVISNLQESNRMWVRLLSAPSVNSLQSRSTRERERHELRVLVGCNLVQLSKLRGLTKEIYATKALPEILNSVIATKEKHSQQYIFESILQVFPAEYHLHSMKILLEFLAQASPSVDVTAIVVALLENLQTFLSDAANMKAQEGIDIFSTLQAGLAPVLARKSVADAAEGTGSKNSGAWAQMFEIQAAFMKFTGALFPGNLPHVDAILGSTADVLKAGLGEGKLPSEGHGKAVDLLSAPLRSLSLGVLEMPKYAALTQMLEVKTQKKVALSIVEYVVEEKKELRSVEMVTKLFTCLAPLTKDTERMDEDALAAEQQEVAKLAHQVAHEDAEAALEILTVMRDLFLESGAPRLKHTLPSTFFATLALLPRMQGPENLELTKKALQIMHKTATCLQKVDPEAAIQAWLQLAKAADDVAKGIDEPHNLGQVCFEFLTQGLICLEEEVSETQKTYDALFSMVGTVSNISCLEAEDFATASQKMVQQANRLMKKHLQVRALAACSHLYWCDAHRDGERVRECLQKCIKTTTALTESDAAHVGLWAEMLDKYVYYFGADAAELTAEDLQTLINLCQEHIAAAEKDSLCQDAASKAKKHFQETVNQLKTSRGDASSESKAKWADLTLP